MKMEVSNNWDRIQLACDYFSARIILAYDFSSGRIIVAFEFSSVRMFLACQGWVGYDAKTNFIDYDAKNLASKPLR